jgi:hypothetical protein
MILVKSDATIPPGTGGASVVRKRVAGTMGRPANLR